MVFSDAIERRQVSKIVYDYNQVFLLVKAFPHDTRRTPMSQFTNPSSFTTENPSYPYAPFDWSESDAIQMARQQGVEIDQDHLELLRALQEYFSKHDAPDVNVRELHDALDEKFHLKGGMKYLYVLFPAGPVAQGCQLAGLPVPAGAIDKSFGSVQ